jgi:hypothetical protein
MCGGTGVVGSSGRAEKKTRQDLYRSAVVRFGQSQAHKYAGVFSPALAQYNYFGQVRWK